MSCCSTSDAEIKMSFPEGKPSLVYWALCGRGDVAKCLFRAAEVEYILDTDTANTWPAYKPECPFGQIPVLFHGDVKLAQGGAINRYVARLGGLYPTDPIEASKCDMIMEEAMDLFGSIFKVRVDLLVRIRVRERNEANGIELALHFVSLTFTVYCTALYCTILFYETAQGCR